MYNSFSAVTFVLQQLSYWSFVQKSSQRSPNKILRAFDIAKLAEIIWIWALVLEKRREHYDSVPGGREICANRGQLTALKASSTSVYTHWTCSLWLHKEAGINSNIPPTGREEHVYKVCRNVSCHTGRCRKRSDLDTTPRSPGDQRAEYTTRGFS